jgi:hypothetical protein
MSRTLQLYVFFLLLLIVGVIYVDAVRPKPINWTPSYLLKDKIPYGLHVFNEEHKDLLKNNNVEKITQTFYEAFEPNYYNEDTLYYSEKRGTLLNICDTYVIDDQSSNEILYYVAEGNNAFLSVENLPKILIDSLKLGLDFKTNFDLKNQSEYWLANSNLGNKKYQLSKGANSYHFSKIDTLKTTVLGYQGSEKEKKVNFIKTPYGNGFFYIHLQPVAFTNYHLLKDNNYEYAEKVLSYLPKDEVYWLVKDQSSLVESYSPMRYILSQPALKWAWYIFLIGIVIFMIFNAKRRQRVIPIIKPLANTTVDFTKTIGNLYYQEGNHQNIIDKKIIYFLERVRNEYLMDTSNLDENFIKKLHLKTGKELKDIEHLVYLINYQRKSYHQSIESDLIEINNAIEKIIN